MDFFLTLFAQWTTKFKLYLSISVTDITINMISSNIIEVNLKYKEEKHKMSYSVCAGDGLLRPHKS